MSTEIFDDAVYSGALYRWFAPGFHGLSQTRRSTAGAARRASPYHVSAHAPVNVDDSILAQLGGEVFVWEPGVSMSQATDYGRIFDTGEPSRDQSVTTEDTVARAIRDPGTTIVRIRHGAPAMDVEAEALGSVKLSGDFVAIRAARDGTRVVLAMYDANGSRERWEMALIPRAGALSAWVTATAPCGRGVRRLEPGRDDAHWVMVSWDGQLCEVAREPLEVRALNMRMKDVKRGHVHWDAKAKRYVVL